MEEKHLIMAQLIYSDGSTKLLDDKFVLISINNDDDVTVETTPDLSNEAIMALCEGTVSSLKGE